MKAIGIRQFGDPGTLEMMALPRPDAGAGEVLVRVMAGSVNPVDTKIRRGLFPFSREFPLILGYDVSGIVEAVGSGVNDFAPGDEVFYMAPLDGPGACAEYHTVPAEIVSLKPANLSHTEAAALPLAGSTAWQALFERGWMAPGMAVLVHGGAGGVGSMAIQIAAWAGCEVFATASEANLDFLYEMGVDQALDYGSEDVPERLMTLTEGAGMDVVLDTVGGNTFFGSIGALSAHGQLVGIAPVDLDDPPPGFFTEALSRNVTLHLLMVEGRRDSLDNLARLVERGLIGPVVNEVVPFQTDRIQEAHRRLEGGHGRGKIVVEIG